MPQLCQHYQAALAARERKLEQEPAGHEAPAFQIPPQAANLCKLEGQAQQLAQAYYSAVGKFLEDNGADFDGALAFLGNLVGKADD